MGSPASLPFEMFQSAQNGELQMVVKWLRKGGLANALCSASTGDGRATTTTMLHAAASNDHLEMVRVLLKRGASIDLQDSLGVTALMGAANQGHLSILLLLLEHLANPDLQDIEGHTALMRAAHQGHEACVQALLQAKANTELLDNNGLTALSHADCKFFVESVRKRKYVILGGSGALCTALPLAWPWAILSAVLLGAIATTAILLSSVGRSTLTSQGNADLLNDDGRTALGHTATSELAQQGAAPPAAAVPAASPEAGELAVSAPASLPFEMLQSAQQGELQKVVKWLRKGGLANARCPATGVDGRLEAATLLHVAATCDHLEMVRVLLKRGASVDLQDSDGLTALMAAAYSGHLSILLLLLEHLANPDLQDIDGCTALMLAAGEGQEACVQALLQAKANTELRTKNFRLTALQLTRLRAARVLIRQHACLTLGLGVALCAALPLAWPWVVLWVVLGAAAAVAFSVSRRTLTGWANTALLNDSGRTALRYAEACGQMAITELIRHAEAIGYAAIAALLRGHTAAAALIRQHARAPPQPAAAAAPRAIQAGQRAARADAAMEKLLAEEAAEQAKAQARSKKTTKKNKAGRAAASSNASNEAPPAAVPAPPPTVAPKPAASPAERAEAARAGDDLERKARQEAAAEAVRLAAAEQVREVAAREAVRVAAASTAAEVAAAAAAAAAVAVAAEASVAAAAEATTAAEVEATALERATGNDNESGSSEAAGPSEASEVPDDYICPITTEIMTDPVSTVDGFTYERTAITEWLRTKDTSPFTGATLESKSLIPNYSLRSVIRSFVEARAVAAAAPPPPSVLPSAGGS